MINYPRPEGRGKSAAKGWNKKVRQKNAPKSGLTLNLPNTYGDNSISEKRTCDYEETITAGIPPMAVDVSPHQP